MNATWGALLQAGGYQQSKSEEIFQSDLSFTGSLGELEIKLHFKTLTEEAPTVELHSPESWPLLSSYRLLSTRCLKGFQGGVQTGDLHFDAEVIVLPEQDEQDELLLLLGEEQREQLRNLIEQGAQLHNGSLLLPPSLSSVCEPELLLDKAEALLASLKSPTQEELLWRAVKDPSPKVRARIKTELNSSLLDFELVMRMLTGEQPEEPALWLASIRPECSEQLERWFEIAGEGEERIYDELLLESLYLFDLEDAVLEQLLKRLSLIIFSSWSEGDEERAAPILEAAQEHPALDSALCSGLLHSPSEAGLAWLRGSQTLGLKNQLQRCEILLALNFQEEGLFSALELLESGPPLEEINSSVEQLSTLFQRCALQEPRGPEMVRFLLWLIQNRVYQLALPETLRDQAQVLLLEQLRADLQAPFAYDVIQAEISEKLLLSLCQGLLYPAPEGLSAWFEALWDSRFPEQRAFVQAWSLGLDLAELWIQIDTEAVVEKLCALQLQDATYMPRFIRLLEQSGFRSAAVLQALSPLLNPAPNADTMEALKTLLFRSLTQDLEAELCQELSSHLLSNSLLILICGLLLEAQPSGAGAWLLQHWERCSEGYSEAQRLLILEALLELEPQNAQALLLQQRPKELRLQRKLLSILKRWRLRSLESAELFLWSISSQRGPKRGHKPSVSKQEELLLEMLRVDLQDPFSKHICQNASLASPILQICRGLCQSPPKGLSSWFGDLWEAQFPNPESALKRERLALQFIELWSLTDQEAAIQRLCAIPLQSLQDPAGALDILADSESMMSTIELLLSRLLQKRPKKLSSLRKLLNILELWRPRSLESAKLLLWSTQFLHDGALAPRVEALLLEMLRADLQDPFSKYISQNVFLTPVILRICGGLYQNPPEGLSNWLRDLWDACFPNPESPLEVEAQALQFLELWSFLDQETAVKKLCIIPFQSLQKRERALKMLVGSKLKAEHVVSAIKPLLDHPLKSEAEKPLRTWLAHEFHQDALKPTPRELCELRFSESLLFYLCELFMVSRPANAGRWIEKHWRYHGESYSEFRQMALLRTLYDFDKSTAIGHLIERRPRKREFAAEITNIIFDNKTASRKSAIFILWCALNGTQDDFYGEKISILIIDNPKSPFAEHLSASTIPYWLFNDICKHLCKLNSKINASLWLNNTIAKPRLKLETKLLIRAHISLALINKRIIFDLKPILSKTFSDSDYDSWALAIRLIDIWISIDPETAAQELSLMRPPLRQVPAFIGFLERAKFRSEAVAEFLIWAMSFQSRREILKLNMELLSPWLADGVDDPFAEKVLQAPLSSEMLKSISKALVKAHTPGGARWFLELLEISRDTCSEEKLWSILEALSHLDLQLFLSELETFNPKNRDLALQALRRISTLELRNPKVLKPLLRWIQSPKLREPIFELLISWLGRALDDSLALECAQYAWPKKFRNRLYQQIIESRPPGAREWLLSIDQHQLSEEEELELFEVLSEFDFEHAFERFGAIQPKNEAQIKRLIPLLCRPEYPLAILALFKWACPPKRPDGPLSLLKSIDESLAQGLILLLCKRPLEDPLLADLRADRWAELKRLPNRIKELLIEALIESKPKGALEILLKLLDIDDNNMVANKRTIYQLQELGDWNAEPLIIRALEKDELKEVAIKALAKLGRRSAIKALGQFTSFFSWSDFREIAQEAIEQIEARLAKFEGAISLQSDKRTGGLSLTEEPEEKL